MLVLSCVVLNVRFCVGMQTNAKKMQDTARDCRGKWVSIVAGSSGKAPTYTATARYLGRYLLISAI
jgi:hypothetical protein